MYKLYYSPGACSMAVHVILNETNTAFDLQKVSLSEGETRTPEYLKMNPRGQVPLLLEDGKPMREGGAMIVYLCDKHKSPLMPQEGWQRAQALQWLMFGNSSMHPAYSRMFWLMKQPQDVQGKDALMQKTAEHISTLWQDVEQQLGSQPYMCGDQCTAADILLTVIANWGGNIPLPITIGPKARAMFARVIARPAYQKALQTEQVQYKMAS